MGGETSKEGSVDKASNLIVVVVVVVVVVDVVVVVIVVVVVTDFRSTTAPSAKAL